MRTSPIPSRMRRIRRQVPEVPGYSRAREFACRQRVTAGASTRRASSARRSASAATSRAPVGERAPAEGAISISAALSVEQDQGAVTRGNLQDPRPSARHGRAPASRRELAGASAPSARCRMPRFQSISRKRDGARSSATRMALSGSAEALWPFPLMSPQDTVSQYPRRSAERARKYSSPAAEIISDLGVERAFPGAQRRRARFDPRRRPAPTGPRRRASRAGTREFRPHRGSEKPASAASSAPAVSMASFNAARSASGGPVRELASAAAATRAKAARPQGQARPRDRAAEAAQGSSGKSRSTRETSASTAA